MKNRRFQLQIKKKLKKIKKAKEIKEEKKAKTTSRDDSDLEKVNINLADSTELEKVKGIGPAYARRIIAYRDENGDFSELDELLNVDGIGPARLESIKPGIDL